MGIGPSSLDGLGMRGDRRFPRGSPPAGVVRTDVRACMRETDQAFIYTKKFPGENK